MERGEKDQGKSKVTGLLFKILLLLLAVQLLAPANLAYVGPDSAQAGWRDKFSSSVNRAKQGVSRSVNRTRQRVRQSVDRTRQRVRQSVNRTRQRTRESVNRTRQRMRQSVDRTRQRVRQSVDRTRQRTRESVNRTRQRVRQSVDQYRQRREQQTQRRRRQLVDMVRNSPASRGLRRFGDRWRGKSPNQILRDIQKTHGPRAVDTIMQARERMGQGAGEAVAAYLARAKTGGMAVLQRAQPMIQRIGHQVRDPRTQRRVVMGVIAAAGVAYYIHKHRDDIQYRAINYGLEHTMVKVGNQRVPLKQIITSQIISRAPYLRGTRLAEDPAASLAYGVVAVGKQDLMNNVALVPNGRGGLCSVNASIRGANHGQDALAALQVGTSLEGMAMTAAENGVAGVYGQTFAGAYRGMEGRLGQ